MKGLFVMSLSIITVIAITIGLVTEYRTHEESITLTGFGSIIVIVLFSVIYEQQRSAKHVS